MLFKYTKENLLKAEKKELRKLMADAHSIRGQSGLIVRKLQAHLSGEKPLTSKEVEKIKNALRIIFILLHQGNKTAKRLMAEQLKIEGAGWQTLEEPLKTKAR